MCDQITYVSTNQIIRNKRRRINHNWNHEEKWTHMIQISLVTILHDKNKLSWPCDQRIYQGLYFGRARIMDEVEVQQRKWRACGSRCGFRRFTPPPHPTPPASNAEALSCSALENWLVPLLDSSLKYLKIYFIFPHFAYNTHILSSLCLVNFEGQLPSLPLSPLPAHTSIPPPPPPPPPPHMPACDITWGYHTNTTWSQPASQPGQREHCIEGHGPLPLQQKSVIDGYGRRRRFIGPITLGLHSFPCWLFGRFLCTLHSIILLNRVYSIHQEVNCT